MPFRVDTKARAPAVREPGRLPVFSRAIRQAKRLASVGIDDPDLRVSRRVRAVGHERPVRRERRLRFPPRRARDLPGGAPGSRSGSAARGGRGHLRKIAAAASPTATAAAAASHGRRARRGLSPDRAATCWSVGMLRRASARSCAVSNRSSGRFSRHRETMSPRAGGISAPARSRDGGSAWRIAEMVSAGVAPAKGRFPTASRRGRTRGRRCRCGRRPSGREAARAPCTKGSRRSPRRPKPGLAEGEVRVTASSETGSTTLARPKSRTLTRPSDVRKTFSGFRSRWTIPAACAEASPSAIAAAISAALRHGNGLAAPSGPAGSRRPGAP